LVWIFSSLLFESISFYFAELKRSIYIFYRSPLFFIPKFSADLSDSGDMAEGNMFDKADNGDISSIFIRQLFICELLFYFYIKSIRFTLVLYSNFKYSLPVIFSIKF
jgi:hypothetical protein